MRLLNLLWFIYSGRHKNSKILNFSTWNTFAALVIWKSVYARCTVWKRSSTSNLLRRRSRWPNSTPGAVQKMQLGYTGVAEFSSIVRRSMVQVLEEAVRWRFRYLNYPRSHHSKRTVFVPLLLKLGNAFRGGVCDFVENGPVQNSGNFWPPWLQPWHLSPSSTPYTPLICLTSEYEASARFCHLGSGGGGLKYRSLCIFHERMGGGTQPAYTISTYSESQLTDWRFGEGNAEERIEVCTVSRLTRKSLFQNTLLDDDLVSGARIIR